MAAILNQFSFVLVAALGGALLGVGLWRWRRPPGGRAFKIGALALYVVLMVALGLGLRYPSQTVLSLAAVEATLDNGRPTFVMLYSNF